MKKITEIEEIRIRTTHSRDRNGKLIRGQEKYVAYRKVRSVSGGPRYAHLFIDGMIFHFILTILSLVLMLPFSILQDSLYGQLYHAIILVFIGLSYPAFYFLFEKIWQKTPAKMLTNSIVINEYGGKPTDKQLLLRTLIRMIPFDSLSFLGDEGRGWHDSWSDTWVVKESELKIMKALLEEQDSSNSD